MKQFNKKKKFPFETSFEIKIEFRRQRGIEAQKEPRSFEKLPKDSFPNNNQYFSAESVNKGFRKDNIS